jgi:hypothetical protein
VVYKYTILFKIFSYKSKLRVKKKAFNRLNAFFNF